MYCFRCSDDSEGSSRYCSRCGCELTSDSDLYFKSGMEALAAGEACKGVRLFESCLALSPEHVNARYNLGIALCLLGEFDRAKRHFTAIARKDRRYPGVFTALGQAAFGTYMELTERADVEAKEMVRMFRRAVQADPEDVDAYFSLANAYMALQRPEKAVPCLERALALHPDSPAIHFTLAKALAMLEKYEEASEMAGRSIDLSGPDDPFWGEMQVLASELHQMCTRI